MRRWGIGSALASVLGGPLVDRLGFSGPGCCRPGLRRGRGRHPAAVPGQRLQLLAAPGASVRAFVHQYAGGLGPLRPDTGPCRSGEDADRAGAATNRWWHPRRRSNRSSPLYSSLAAAVAESISIPHTGSVTVAITFPFRPSWILGIMPAPSNGTNDGSAQPAPPPGGLYDWSVASIGVSLAATNSSRERITSTFSVVGERRRCWLAER